MVSAPQLAPTRRRVGGRAVAEVRALPPPVGSRLLWAVLTTLLIATTVLIMRYPDAVPWALYLPIVTYSGVHNSIREHAVLVLEALACFSVSWWYLRDIRHDALGALIAMMLVAAITMWRAQARDRVGVAGVAGERMLVDLRARLKAHGALPVLPPGWKAELSVRSAYGNRFSGDFFVTHRSGSERIDVVLVDVSGKGLEAGARSLMMAGALKALVSAVPSDRFMSAANDYLLQQNWVEGFATAVHLTVDLRTGGYAVYSAGHPPILAFHAGAGMWEQVEEQGGPALGVIPGANYPGVTGHMEPGDALLLYSDGLIEDRAHPIDAGIDRLKSRAEEHVVAGFVGATSALCREADRADDRAAFLIWRP